MSTEMKATARAVIRTYWLPELLAGIAVLLLVASFIVPPTGIIDPSVLAGAGEISLLSAMFSGIILIEHGRKVSISKGDMTITTNGEREEYHEIDTAEDIQG